MALILLALAFQIAFGLLVIIALAFSFGGWRCGLLYVAVFGGAALAGYVAHLIIN